MAQFGYRVHTISGRSLQEITSNDLETIASKLTLNDINKILYRCEAEELNDMFGEGCYDIPGHGTMPYCGIQGMYFNSKCKAF